MDSWTGAEIQAWCKLAAKKISKGKSANDADDLILPIAKTMNKEIDYLRKWSEGRTIKANKKLIKIPTPATRNLEM